MLESIKFPVRQALRVLTAMLVLSGGISHADPLVPPPQPTWWSNGTPPVLNGAQPNNHGLASIGQAKWMASEALRSLDATAPEVSTLIRNDLAGTASDHSDRIVDWSVPSSPKPVEWLEQQKAPLLLGQLKAIALPFYNRLNQADHNWLLGQINLNQPNGVAILGTHYWIVTGNAKYIENGCYPWNPGTASEVNKSPVTIGQLKAIFSLRFEDPSFSPQTINESGSAVASSVSADSNNDGLGDAWEMLWFGSLNAQTGNGCYSGDGIMNKYKEQAHTDPTKNQSTDPTLVYQYYYDTEGRLLSIRGVASASYTYDEEGNLKSEQ